MRVMSIYFAVNVFFDKQKVAESFYKVKINVFDAMPPEFTII